MAAINEVKQSGTGGGIPDAPADGKQYARQNKKWAEVKSGGYEPPADGIPKKDLASDVQHSLEKADSSIQTDKTIRSETISIDTTVTEDSDNLITSGAVFDFVTESLSGALGEIDELIGSGVIE